MTKKYISLDDAEKIWKLKHTPEVMAVDKEGQYILFNNLYYLPTYPDPIFEIDKMIEENKKSSDYMNDKLAGPTREQILQELRTRLNPH